MNLIHARLRPGQFPMLILVIMGFLPAVIPPRALPQLASAPAVGQATTRHGLIRWYLENFFSRQ